ncbi:MAG: hypothetical protein OIF48_15935 [Silicimonas sp.]|nr:hypothetical protein [Silicimonas sp.]
MSISEMLPTAKDSDGWQEELEPYRISESSFAIPNRVEYSSQREVEVVSSKIPIRLAELILGIDVLEDAIKKRHVWSKILEEIPDISADHPRWSELPYEASVLLINFESWFTLRVGEPNFYGSWLDCAEGISYRVLDGKFSSPHDDQALKYVCSDPWTQFFDGASS